jgi:hypothetical protein
MFGGGTCSRSAGGWIADSRMGEQPLLRRRGCTPAYTETKSIGLRAVWRANGYAHVIPDDRVHPSEDGDVWLFFWSSKDGYQSAPFCFFVPQGST